MKNFKQFVNENLKLEGTKIVDEDGNPLVVYRSQKDKRKQGVERSSNLKGIYFSADEDSTKIYGDITKEYYLDIRNPIILKDKEWNLSVIPEYLYLNLIEKGYDGAIWLRNGVMYEIVAFYDWQVIPKEINEKLSKWKENWVKDIYSDYKIGQEIPSHEILEYVSSFHDREDFDDTDFWERIMEFDYFKYEIIDIEELDLDRFHIEEDKVEEYIEDYKEFGTYPPIVLKNDLEIIDGTHRLNALYKTGLKKVRCFVGYY